MGTDNETMGPSVPTCRRTRPHKKHCLYSLCVILFLFVLDCFDRFASLGGFFASACCPVVSLLYSETSSCFSSWLFHISCGELSCTLRRCWWFTNCTWTSAFGTNWGWREAVWLQHVLTCLHRYYDQSCSTKHDGKPSQTPVTPDLFSHSRALLIWIWL